MDAERKQKIINAACWFCAGVIACGAMFYLRSGGDDASSAGRNGASTVEQAARAAELNELARAENKSAGAAVDRADERAGEAAEINQRAQAELARSKELLEQVRADNQRAKQILGELIAGVETRRKADEKN